jgi:hypothetical protein
MVMLCPSRSADHDQRASAGSLPALNGQTSPPCPRLLEGLHEECVNANPHSVTMRDELLDAIVERLRERAGLGPLADEIEQHLRALRDCEKEEWEPEFGGLDRLRDLMSERIAGFRMHTPSLKPLDPLWRRRAFGYLAAEAHFRAASYEMETFDGVTSPNRAHWEPVIKTLWMGRQRSGAGSLSLGATTNVDKVEEPKRRYVPVAVNV